MSSRAVRFSWSIVFMFMAGGCELLDVNKTDFTRTAMFTRANKESLGDRRVLLEVVSLRVTDTNSAAADAIWQQADEQQLPTPLRRHLADNGFRIGKLGGSMPREIEQLLAAGKGQLPGDSDLDEQANMRTKVVRNRFSLRPSRRGIIATSTNRPKVAAFFVDQGGDVSGQTYVNAQSVFSVKCHPEGNGSVNIELVPEIHHGQMKQTIVGSDYMFRMRMQRPEKMFHSLKSVVNLLPGEILLIGSRQASATSVGHVFMNDHSSETPSSKLMVIRFVQSGTDEWLTTGNFDPSVESSDNELD